jgi:hypothetical protein
MAEATQHISLKVKLDDDIRRFSVPKNITFAELHVLIAKHFVLAPENVQVKYVDDEEEARSKRVVINKDFYNNLMMIFLYSSSLSGPISSFKKQRACSLRYQDAFLT